MQPAIRLGAAAALATLVPAAANAALITGLTAANELVMFDSATPGTILSTVAITGLSDQKLLGIDTRPMTGQLYALGASGQLYTLNQVTGAAIKVGTPNVTLNGTDFGFAFNPVPDRIRVVSDANQNLRLNPITGRLATPAPDPDLKFKTAAPADVNAGIDANVTAVAYTNQNFGVITSTTLYDIDTNLDVLAIQNPPNDGVLNTQGNLMVDAIGNAGFDIAGVTNIAYASLTTAAGLGLYTIDITAGSPTLGKATMIGGIGANVTDIAVFVPEPAALALIGTGLLGLAGARRRTARG